MATFVLVPGAGGNASFWHRLVPQLERRGHAAIPVGIPEDDPALGLPEYARLVEDAMGDHDDVVLVAQSLGGFTAPMVRKRVRMIVLLNAMVPLPGETPGDWWGNTGSGEARRAAEVAAGHGAEFDVEWHFLHDVPAEARTALEADPPREPSDTPFGQPCAFDRWPDVPLRVLVGRDDRFFPAEFQTRVARERLGITAELVPGGHCAALSNPAGLADRLVEYVSAS